ncbi:MAG: hypothetical protein RLZZ106_1102, partial [Cyanobacteriota bacterium]
MLAEPPRLPQLSVVPVARHSSAAGYSVEEVLHHSPRRVRFRVGGASSSWPKLEQALHQASEVKHVRLNAMAGCCVVEFERNAAIDPLQWLQQLPGALPSLQRSADAPSATQKPAKAQNPEGEDDESFVPSRIILPVSSLALALLAGPLALPPLAVAGFILVSAHLSFKRAWQGLKEERKINVDFLDALAVSLHSLEGFLVGPAMMITMIEG